MTNGPHIDNHNNDEVPRPMKVNVVRVLEDRDFNYVKHICDHHVDWEMVYEKKKTRVWTKLVADSDFQMIKLRAEFPDVPASIAYDVLHDTEYRHKWDKYTHRSQDIGLINPNTDICYYALSSMPPFTSRDFVLQRSWLDLGNEKYIIGHSVCHEYGSGAPPFQNLWRRPCQEEDGMKKKEEDGMRKKEEDEVNFLNRACLSTRKHALFKKLTPPS
uniref:START domain-containing protein n=1 Tax=Acrobeloides nanus TaxID=290746 RepID=A0A914DYD3_9BILA